MDDSDTYGEYDVDNEEESGPGSVGGAGGRSRRRNVLDDGRADAPDRNDAVDSFGRTLDDDTQGESPEVS